MSLPQFAPPPQVPTNGAHAPSPPPDDAGTAPTVAYEAFLNGCSLEVIWKVMEPHERREIIRNITDPEDYGREEYLQEIAGCWHDGAERLAIKARASITASATFGHSASPDNVACWHIMTLQ